MGAPKIVASVRPNGEKADLELTLFGVPPTPVNWRMPNLDPVYAGRLAEAINQVDPNDREGDQTR